MVSTNLFISSTVAQRKEDGEKVAYPEYIGGCRQDLPGMGGPWKLSDACKDYTVSKEFAKDFFEDEKWKNISNWKLDMENAREQKVQMCYCSWDDKCNEVGKTIGVSKSGVATLALTTVLLIGAITGSYLSIA